MKIKSAMSYHFTLVRRTIIKKSTNNKCWRGCGERGTVLHCWWQRKLVQPLWRTVRWFLKKLNPELSYDPAAPLLCMHLEKARVQKDACSSVFTAALFPTAKTRKPLKYPLTGE